MLSTQAFKKSEDAALKLISEFKIHSAPVPVEDIIRNLELELFEYNLGDDVSGVLVITNQKGTIGYNPKDGYLRQRFTMAHELGHYILHNSKTSDDLFVDKDFLFKKFRHLNTYTPTEKKQEQEANAFAAALLMPTNFIEKEMESDEMASLREGALVSALANKFKVSEVAMSYRLANLSSF